LIVKVQNLFILQMKNSEYAEYFDRLSETLHHIDTDVIEQLADMLLKARDKGNTIYIFGNGGSAATASHVTGDFIKGISYQMDKRFKVQCLNDNISGMMAISNDLNYEEIFIEQLRAFLKKGDIVIGISGSGNSVNVIKAMEYARSLGAHTVTFCGFTGGRIKDIANLVIYVPINDMEITEDIHIIIFHALKQSLIRKLKGNSFSMGKTYDERVK
jgi:D-sedoheptulose 7-phosphate isomerase